ncbi:DUF6934 family protein [Dyadobacter sandarakinus]|uniref:Uncharacterized protein n=1 Tax=Dyadobacter sandarakinus TaxID=2747268 RepID=A0ABX7I967_9BACT|nr:hypothetical protein [Dyadobacter sandarakinus]QRR02062.1 hypothetical protein HWI92_14670 [Dyadobacter sandarakinus]
MTLHKYPVTIVDPREYPEHFNLIDVLGAWKFCSEGRNGRFELRVLITRSKQQVNKARCNLGFGVFKDEGIDDFIETRNGDMQHILATVAAIAVNFLAEYPELELYAEGSTPARTRLYQREIAKVIDQLPPALAIYGLVRGIHGGFIKFRRGVNFDAFLLLKY